MIRKLSLIIGSFKKRFAFSILWGSSVALAASVVNPLVIKFMFDEGVIAGNFRLFIILGVGSFSFFTLLRVLEHHHITYLERLKVLMSERLTLKVISAFYATSYKEVIERDDGYFVARLVDESERTSRPIIDTISDFLISSASLIGALLVIVYISWQLTLILCCVVPFLLWASTHFSTRIYLNSKDTDEERAAFKDWVAGLVKSYKTVNMFDLLPLIRMGSQQRYQTYGKAQEAKVRTESAYTTLSGIFMSVIGLVATVGGGYAVLIGSLQFGGYMGFISAYWTVIGSASELVELLPKFSTLLASIDRINATLNVSNISTNQRRTSSLSVRNLSYSYTGEPIFENYSFKLEPGEKVLLLGANGTGKSTLANIFSGFLEPLEGEVIFPERISALVEPVHFPSLSLNMLIPVGQEVKAFNLMQSLDILHCTDKLYKDLSLGQKKKFCVVMTLLKDAQVYILDEPLANVDSAGRDNITNAVFEYTKNKGLIIIAHEAQDISSMFDRVVSLNPGVFVEPRKNPTLRIWIVRVS